MRHAPVHLLGAHVGRGAGANDEVCNLRKVVHDFPRHAEVRELRLARAVDHDVRGLEVAVGNLGLRVRVVQRVTELLDPGGDFIHLKDRRQPFFLHPFVHQLAERQAVHELHMNRRQLAARAGPGIAQFQAIDADDVMVREIEAAEGLPAQLVEDKAVSGQNLRQKFESHLAVEIAVVGEPDHAHRALAQQPLEREMGENLLADAQRHRARACHVRAEVVIQGRWAIGAGIAGRFIAAHALRAEMFPLALPKIG